VREYHGSPSARPRHHYLRGRILVRLLLPKEERQVPLALQVEVGAYAPKISPPEAPTSSPSDREVGVSKDSTAATAGPVAISKGRV